MFGKANISLKEAYDVFYTEITKLFHNNPWLPFAVLLLATAIAIYILIRSIIGLKKRKFENGVFIGYCSAVVVLLVISTLARGVGGIGDSPAAAIISYAVYAALPSVYCLHIWTQVSYEKIKVSTLVLYFIIPAASTGMYLARLLGGFSTPDIGQYFIMLPLGYMTVIYLIYWICIMIKSFRLCLNVFYQMPRHMQESTTLLLSALAMSLAVMVITVASGSPKVMLVFQCVLVYILVQSFRGFFSANSANVIATSRKFVYNNFGMQIIILSRKGRILEWNNPNDNFLIKAVPLRYLQSYSDFRENMIKKCAGRVSPHDPDVITLTIDGVERAIQIRRQPIKHGDKEYGELVEINEVTHLYDVLHQMEEISMIDQMTGLGNRNAYIAHARDVMRPGNMPLLIMIGDVNDLKLVNDQLGHLVGDRMLHDVSNILKECLPEGGFIARIGGDEFVILLPNAGEEDAEKLVDNIHRLCGQIDDMYYGKLNISLGWAVANSADEDYNAVFSIADEWMYMRKKEFKQKSDEPRQLSGML